MSGETCASNSTDERNIRNVAREQERADDSDDRSGVHSFLWLLQAMFGLTQTMCLEMAARQDLEAA